MKGAMISVLISGSLICSRFKKFKGLRGKTKSSQRAAWVAKRKTDAKSIVKKRNNGIGYIISCLLYKMRSISLASDKILLAYVRQMYLVQFGLPER